MSLLRKLFPSFFPAPALPGTAEHDALQVLVFFNRTYRFNANREYDHRIKQIGTAADHDTLMRLKFPATVDSSFNAVAALAFAFPLADFAWRWGMNHPVFLSLYGKALLAANLNPKRDKGVDTGIMARTVAAITKGRQTLSRQDLLEEVLAAKTPLGVEILQPFVDTVSHEIGVWLTFGLKFSNDQAHEKVGGIAKALCSEFCRSFDRERFMSSPPDAGSGSCGTSPA